MKRINWTKARKFKISEEKYDDGSVLKNGRVVTSPKDSLSARAAAAEKRWLKKIGRDKV